MLVEVFNSPPGQHEEQKRKDPKRSYVNSKIGMI